MAATIQAAQPATAGAASQIMPSDALVFFGATGDLAYKKIFPALQHMIRRGTLDAPVIGVAKSGWTIEQLRERARDSLTQHGGGVDEAAFTKLVQWLRYVDGDYQDPGTFDRLRQALGSAARPTHYLAIPPSLFGTVVEALGRSGCAHNARLVIEKPFGHDLASAQHLNATLHAVFPEACDLSHRPLPRQRGGGESPLLSLRQYLPGADLEPELRPERADHHGGALRRRGPRPVLR